MCIRDRFWTYPRGSFHYDVMVTLILAFLFLSPRLINYRDRPQETLTSTRDILVRANGTNAVSYTHLDVYKRQLRTPPGWPNGSKTWPSGRRPKQRRRQPRLPQQR